MRTKILKRFMKHLLGLMGAIVGFGFGIVSLFKLSQLVTEKYLSPFRNQEQMNSTTLLVAVTLAIVLIVVVMAICGIWQTAKYEVEAEEQTEKLDGEIKELGRPVPPKPGRL